MESFLVAGSYYAAHKITLHGYKGHFSAWFTLDGKLDDAHQYGVKRPSQNRRGNITSRDKAWTHLQGMFETVKAKTPIVDNSK